MANKLGEDFVLHRKFIFAADLITEQPRVRSEGLVSRKLVKCLPSRPRRMLERIETP